MFRCCLFLVAVFPLTVGHAVDPLSGFVHGDIEPGIIGGRLVPFGKTIPAKVREDHEIDVLHIGVHRKMVEESTKRGGVEPVLICIVEVFVIWHGCSPEILTISAFPQ